MHVDTRPMGLRDLCSILATVTLTGALALGIAPAVHAQALDQVVVELLSGNCEGLGFPASEGSGFGDNLSAICNTQGVGNSTGGGATSPQASTLSLQNGLIQERLERTREGKKRDDEKSSVVSALSRGRSGSAHLTGSATAEDSGTSASAHRFNLFASGTYESVDRKVTQFEDGYDSSIQGGAVGFDYQFSDAVVAGLVFGYRKHAGDFGGGGDFEMTAFEPSVYVSVLPSPTTFLQFVAGYGGQNSDVERNILYTVSTGGTVTPFGGLAASAADAKAYSGGAQFGYDHAAGRCTFGPRIGVNYNRTTIDPYTESGTTGLELHVEERTVRSLQGVIGFYGSGAFSAKSGVVIPQFNVEYVREFEDDASIVTAQLVEDPNATPVIYQTNAPASDFFNIEAGVGAVFAHGIQLFINLRTMVGNDNFNSSGGTIGMRFEL